MIIFIFIFAECPQEYFGYNCSIACTCNKLNTDVCDSVNGSCTCLDGWTGSTCNDDIDECKDESLYTCGDHTQCDNIDGSYICTCDVGYVSIGGGQCEGILLLYSNMILRLC